MSRLIEAPGSRQSMSCKAMFLLQVKKRKKDPLIALGFHQGWGGWGGGLNFCVRSTLLREKKSDPQINDILLQTNIIFDFLFVLIRGNLFKMRDVYMCA